MRATLHPGVNYLWHKSLGVASEAPVEHLGARPHALLQVGALL